MVTVDIGGGGEVWSSLPTVVITLLHSGGRGAWNPVLNGETVGNCLQLKPMSNF